MTMTVNDILSLLQRVYPDWQGFTHPQFTADELEYKYATIAKARDLLSHDALASLLKNEQADEFISRLETIANDNNLLWRRNPSAGDTGILYLPGLDKPAFCRAMFDLLHGPDDSPVRLGRYLDYVQANNLPNKWTFPTYFLFIVHPGTEFFVKPSVTQAFLKMMGQPELYHRTPAAERYTAIRGMAYQLRDLLANYNPRDMVDVQSVIWVINFQEQASHIAETAEPYDAEGLAAPFDRIFQTRAEAEWAFDLLADSFAQLGISAVDDERFAVTLRHNATTLRLNFGKWAILQFSNRQQIGLVLADHTAEAVGVLEKWWAFTDGQPPLSVYKFPVDQVRPLTGPLRQVYEQALAQVAGQLGHWRSSSVRRFNQPEIAAAILDATQRAKILSRGLTVEIPDEPEDSTGLADNACFTLRTRELLADLHTNPTKDFYQTHKNDFKALLEEPFQQLMREVATTLPPAITKVMETEKKIFARILKNDYGQGGAWDFYWGAFYPKGGKRTEDAQLSMWIDHQFFECGFYIGTYGSERRNRFIRNCQIHYHRLVLLLEGTLSQDNLYFSVRHNLTVTGTGEVIPKKPLTWQEWLQNPELADCDASFVTSWPRLVQYSRAALVQTIRDVYTSLFPLVLLATQENPIPDIVDYLGLADDDDDDDDEEEPKINEPYSLPEMAHETGLDEPTLRRWVRALQRKKQVILYGPPGTGKTYAAKRLARHLIGGGAGFVEVVQFHPSYAYEDFMQGIRPHPQTDGTLSYRLEPGRFMEFCQKAQDKNGLCVLIIDEINRANLSRVFGELMYLLEYRNDSIPLAGSRQPFHIPENVRLIGTMNTADRSIALVDHALRRRFAFLALYPDFGVLQRFHQQEQTGFPIESLIAELKRLNRTINDTNYEVGISFFLRKDLGNELADIWQMEIEPYLEEYFFDQLDTVDEFRWDKVRVQLSK